MPRPLVFVSVGLAAVYAQERIVDAEVSSVWSALVPHTPTMAGNITYGFPAALSASPSSRRRAQDEEPQCATGEFFDSDGTRQCTSCTPGYFSTREGGRSRTGLTAGFGNLLLGLPGTPGNPAECVYDPCIETCGPERCGMECYQVCNAQKDEIKHESGLNGIRRCGAFSQSSIGANAEPNKYVQHSPTPPS